MNSEQSIPGLSNEQAQKLLDKEIMKVVQKHDCSNSESKVHKSDTNLFIKSFKETLLEILTWYK